MTYPPSRKKRTGLIVGLVVVLVALLVGALALVFLKVETKPAEMPDSPQTVQRIG